MGLVIDLKKINIEKILLVVLLVLTASLRLINLSYSDYIQDEVASFFYWDGQKNTHMNRLDFLLNEQRGPLNVIVGAIPQAFIGNYDNEFAQRLPFSLFNIAAILIFYFLVKRITKSVFVAFLSAFLLSVNGLIVAYGRTAQQQSIMFTFIFSSLYFYAALLNSKIKSKDALKNTLIGTLMFCFAFYTHWYSFFILFPISYILLKYFLEKNVKRNTIVTIVISNLLLALSIILPYFIPYFSNLFENNRNVGYADSIFGKGTTFFNRPDLKQFKLYNPFLTSFLYFTLGIVGAVISRKKPLFIVWFFAPFLFFRFFVTYSGLHFYQIFLPVTVLVAVGFRSLIMSRHHIISIPSVLLLLVTMPFLYIQSYMLFVDPKTEYPMQQEKILLFKTKKYTHEDTLGHKTGFPHKRYWKQINDFVNEQNLKNNEAFGYYTNEDKGIARIYMDSQVVTGDYFYAVGIKRPLSFAFDYKFPQFKPKTTVYEIENSYGEMVVKIYRVEVRKK